MCARVCVSGEERERERTLACCSIPFCLYSRTGVLDAESTQGEQKGSDSTASMADKFGENESADTGQEPDRFGREDEDDDASKLSEIIKMKRGKILESFEGVAKISFVMMGRFSEISSVVRVLQMISFYVELLGSDLKPKLGVVCDELPRVWTAATQRFAETEWPWLSRLYSSLASVVNHLVSRLNIAATSDARVQGIIYPLLDHIFQSKDIQESLAEDALGLWRTILASGEDAGRPLVRHLPMLLEIMGRGEQHFLGFSILEAMLILGFKQDVGRQWPKIVEHLFTSVAEASPLAQGGDIEKTLRKGGGTEYTRRASEEAMVATSLISLLLQLYPTEMHRDLLPLFALIAATISYISNRTAMEGAGGLPNQPSSVVAVIPRLLATLFGAYTETLCYLLYQNPGLYPEIFVRSSEIMRNAGIVLSDETYLLKAILESAEPKRAEKEAEGWKYKEREQAAMESADNASGPRLPNMRYEFVPLLDSDGLGRHRRFFVGVACCALIVANIERDGKLLNIPMIQDGKFSPIIRRMIKLILRANEDRLDIEYDREQIVKSVQQESLETSKENDNMFGAHPTDETTRRRLHLAMRDPLWGVTVPSALQICASRLANIVANSVELKRTSNAMTDLAAALDLDKAGAATIAKICSGEQQQADASVKNDKRAFFARMFVRGSEEQPPEPKTNSAAETMNNHHINSADAV